MDGELTFDEEEHAYYWNGQRVPYSVTQILEPLHDFSMVDPIDLEYAAERGGHVHLACELYDTVGLNWDSLDPVLVPYAEGWVRFRKETGFVIVAVEQKVYHTRLRYAGRIDRVGYFPGDAYYSVLDLKSTSVLYRATGVQLIGYREAGNVWPKFSKRIRGRYAVRLVGDGSYRLQKYTAHIEDWLCFEGLLRLSEWKRSEL